MRSPLPWALVLAPLALFPAHSLADSQFLSMDSLPSEEGWWEAADGGGSSSVSGGFLTIDSPSYREWNAPSRWIDTVDNAIGWEIEFRVRLTASVPGGALTIWIHDREHLLELCLERDQVYICYPTIETYPMDTGDAQHTYRIVGQGTHADIFIDGALVFPYDFTTPTGGTEALIFGDMAGGYMTLSEWDYFSWSTDGLPVPANGATWGRIRALFRS